MRAFAQADRFVSEVEARKLRPVYVFVGDEVFFRKRCREAILQHLVPAELRDFSLFECDLSETDLAEILERVYRGKLALNKTEQWAFLNGRQEAVRKLCEKFYAPGTTLEAVFKQGQTFGQVNLTDYLHMLG